VILVTAMFFIHSSYVKAKIGSYDNLKSIALNDECVYRYSYFDGKLVEFEFEFELTNYSSDKRTFEIVMEIQNIDNKKLRFTTESDAIYTLGGNETRIFHVSIEDNDVVLDTVIDSTHFGGNGSSEYIVLRDDLDNEYVISTLNHIGVVMNRN